MELYVAFGEAARKALSENWDDARKRELIELFQIFSEDGCTGHTTSQILENIIATCEASQTASKPLDPTRVYQGLEKLKFCLFQSPNDPQRAMRMPRQHFSAVGGWPRVEVVNKSNGLIPNYSVSRELLADKQVVRKIKRPTSFPKTSTSSARVIGIAQPPKFTFHSIVMMESFIAIAKAANEFLIVNELLIQRRNQKKERLLRGLGTTVDEILSKQCHADPTLIPFCQAVIDLINSHAQCHVSIPNLGLESKLRELSRRLKAGLLRLSHRTLAQEETVDEALKQLQEARQALSLPALSPTGAAQPSSLETLQRLLAEQTFDACFLNLDRANCTLAKTVMVDLNGNASAVFDIHTILLVFVRNLAREYLQLTTNDHTEKEVIAAAYCELFSRIERIRERNLWEILDFLDKLPQDDQTVIRLLLADASIHRLLRPTCTMISFANVDVLQQALDDAHRCYTEVSAVISLLPNNAVTSKQKCFRIRALSIPDDDKRLVLTLVESGKKLEASENYRRAFHGAVQRLKDCRNALRVKVSVLSRIIINTNEKQMSAFYQRCFQYELACCKMFDEFFPELTLDTLDLGNPLSGKLIAPVIAPKTKLMVALRNTLRQQAINPRDAREYWRLLGSNECSLVEFLKYIENSQHLNVHTPEMPVIQAKFTRETLQGICISHQKMIRNCDTGTLDGHIGKIQSLVDRGDPMLHLADTLRLFKALRAEVSDVSNFLTLCLQEQASMPDVDGNSLVRLINDNTRRVFKMGRLQELDQTLKDCLAFDACLSPVDRANSGLQRVVVLTLEDGRVLRLPDIKTILLVLVRNLVREYLQTAAGDDTEKEPVAAAYCELLARIENTAVTNLQDLVKPRVSLSVEDQGDDTVAAEAAVAAEVTRDPLQGLPHQDQAAIRLLLADETIDRFFEMNETVIRSGDAGLFQECLEEAQQLDVDFQKMMQILQGKNLDTRSPAYAIQSLKIPEKYKRDVLAWLGERFSRGEESAELPEQLKFTLELHGRMLTLRVAAFEQIVVNIPVMKNLPCQRAAVVRALPEDTLQSYLDQHSAFDRIFPGLTLETLNLGQVCQVNTIEIPPFFAFKTVLLVALRNTLRAKASEIKIPEQYFEFLCLIESRSLVELLSSFAQALSDRAGTLPELQIMKDKFTRDIIVKCYQSQFNRGCIEAFDARILTSYMQPLIHALPANIEPTLASFERLAAEIQHTDKLCSLIVREPTQAIEESSTQSSLAQEEYQAWLCKQEEEFRRSCALGNINLYLQAHEKFDSYFQDMPCSPGALRLQRDEKDQETVEFCDPKTALLVFYRNKARFYPKNQPICDMLVQIQNTQLIELPGVLEKTYLWRTHKIDEMFASLLQKSQDEMNSQVLHRCLAAIEQRYQGLSQLRYKLIMSENNLGPLGRLGLTFPDYQDLIEFQSLLADLESYRSFLAGQADQSTSAGDAAKEVTSVDGFQALKIVRELKQSQIEAALELLIERRIKLDPMLCQYQRLCYFELQSFLALQQNLASIDDLRRCISSRSQEEAQINPQQSAKLVAIKDREIARFQEEDQERVVLHQKWRQSYGSYFRLLQCSLKFYLQRCGSFDARYEYERGVFHLGNNIVIPADFHTSMLVRLRNAARRLTWSPQEAGLSQELLNLLNEIGQAPGLDVQKIFTLLLGVSEPLKKKLPVIQVVLKDEAWIGVTENPLRLSKALNDCSTEIIRFLDERGQVSLAAQAFQKEFSAVDNVNLLDELLRSLSGVATQNYIFVTSSFVKKISSFLEENRRLKKERSRLIVLWQQFTLAMQPPDDAAGVEGDITKQPPGDAAEVERNIRNIQEKIQSLTQDITACRQSIQDLIISTSKQWRSIEVWLEVSLELTEQLNLLLGSLMANIATLEKWVSKDELAAKAKMLEVLRSQAKLIPDAEAARTAIQQEGEYQAQACTAQRADDAEDEEDYRAEAARLLARDSLATDSPQGQPAKAQTERDMLLAQGMLFAVGGGHVAQGILLGMTASEAQPASRRLGPVKTAELSPAKPYEKPEYGDDEESAAGTSQGKGRPRSAIQLSKFFEQQSSPVDPAIQLSEAVASGGDMVQPDDEDKDELEAFALEQQEGFKIKKMGFNATTGQ